MQCLKCKAKILNMPNFIQYLRSVILVEVDAACTVKIKQMQSKLNLSSLIDQTKYLTLASCKKIISKKK